MKNRSGNEFLATALRPNPGVASRLHDHRIYKTLVERAPDGILVVGKGGVIVLSNLEAERMFGYSRDEISRLIIEELIPDRLRERHAAQRDEYNRNPRTRPMGTDLNLIARRKDGSEFPVEIMLSSLQFDRGVFVLATIRDIEGRKKQDEKVKTLTGLLPICAWCKKIRNDKGYWSQVEEYIVGHSNADFTHGICPECAAKAAAEREARHRP